MTHARVKIGAKIDSMDKILGEIENKKEHLSLLQESKTFQKKLEQIDREREEMVRRMGEIDAKMVYKDYGLFT